MRNTTGKNIILLTGRAGSKSIPKKNVYPILGRPLAYYPMLAARKSRLTDDIYVSTDCPDIKEVARSMNIKIIQRPENISQDNSELVDALIHAMEYIGDDINYLITMHCNCGVHRLGLVDECIESMNNDDSADSCVSGYIDHSVHPYRTKRFNGSGFLEPWMDMPQSTSTNRQSLSPCFILDGAVRVIRASTCFPPSGQPPFSYLGKNLLPVENSEGGDIHGMKDVVTTEYLLENLGWTENRTPYD